jgi:hypothetical protein
MHCRSVRVASLEIMKFSPKILILLYTSFLTRQTAHKSGIQGTVSKNLVVAVETLLRGTEFSRPAN